MHRASVPRLVGGRRSGAACVEDVVEQAPSNPHPAREEGVGVEDTCRVVVRVVVCCVVVVVGVEHRGKRVVSKWVAERVAVAKERPEEIEGVDSCVRTASRKCRSCTIPSPASLTQALLTITVKGRPLISITEHFISFSYLFEFLLGIWLLIFVRMKLQRHLSVGLFHLLLPRPLLHPEYLVVVFPHSCQMPTFLLFTRRPASWQLPRPRWTAF